MPWTRLRTGPPDSRRRQSALQLNSPEGPDNGPDRIGHDTREPDFLTAASPSVSTFMHQENALHTSLSHGQDPSSNAQDLSRTKSQRFNLLKFRHASDSQLSRTAKEQSMVREPMPAGKSTPTRESDSLKQRSFRLPNSSSYRHDRASHRTPRPTTEEKICISTTPSSKAGRWTSLSFVQALKFVAQGQQHGRRSRWPSFCVEQPKRSSISHHFRPAGEAQDIRCASRLWRRRQLDLGSTRVSII